MGIALWFINTIINFVNGFVSLSMKYPFYFIGGLGIFIFFNVRKNYKYAKSFILLQHGYIILDGLFQAGKTRFLALIAREARKNGFIVCCNYYNKYENIRWGSKTDLINLLNDLWILGEYQNYTVEDIREMYEKEGKERVKQKIQKNLEIKKKFPNIPGRGFHSKILLEGDEMQNIFYNREAMQNFSGENKKLLKLLHQVRHFNLLAVFALTNAQEIDLKFRRIASLYLSFGEVLGGLFLKYVVYNFTIDKENNFDIDKAQKLTKVPVVKFNGYYANKIINRIEKIIKRHIKFRFSELGFKTKFNADPDVDIYRQGYIFEYLNNYYKDERNLKDILSN